LTASNLYSFLPPLLLPHRQKDSKFFDADFKFLFMLPIWRHLPLFLSKDGFLAKMKRFRRNYKFQKNDNYVVRNIEGLGLSLQRRREEDEGRRKSTEQDM